jgi:hypothetical protein
MSAREPRDPHSEGLYTARTLIREGPVVPIGVQCYQSRPDADERIPWHTASPSRWWTHAEVPLPQRTATQLQNMIAVARLNLNGEKMRELEELFREFEGH